MAEAPALLMFLLKDLQFLGTEKRGLHAPADAVEPPIPHPLYGPDVRLAGPLLVRHEHPGTPDESPCPPSYEHVFHTGMKTEPSGEWEGSASFACMGMSGLH